jgi:hypothetical protein
MPPYACLDKRIAILSMPSWNGSPVAPPEQPVAPPEQHDSDDDSHLAAMYIRMWSLASGRKLRDDIPPDQLGEDELIAFWADDLASPSGRHAFR